jgi:hypothetical protein
MRKLSLKAMPVAEVERGLAPSEPLTDGVGSVLNREVYFPLAGYAGPGFHTWPSGHIPQDNGSESASPHPTPCQKNVR